MGVHPLAIVSPKAQIDSNVEIGPYSIIEENVVIGQGTIIKNNVMILAGTKIGEENYIGSGTIVGSEPQDKKFKGEKSYCVIGDKNIIKEYVTISRASGEREETKIGDENFFMINSHIGHNCEIGNKVVLTNLASLGGYVKVEDQAIIGGMVGIHQFVRIGKLAMIGGFSAIRQDVPPFALVIGNPARLVGINLIGLKRAGTSQAVRDEIKKAYKMLFKDLATSQAIKKIEKENIFKSKEVAHLLSFLKNSERGFYRFTKDEPNIEIETTK